MRPNYEPECRVSVIGGVVLDLITVIESLKVESSGWQLSTGYTLDPGNIYTTALTIRNLGAPVSILGWTGNDSFGDIALNKIEQEGFDISGIVKLTGSTTTVLAITDSKGNHSRIVLPGKNHIDTFPDTWQTILEKSSIIYLSGFSCIELAQEIIFKIIDITEKNQIPLVFDPQTAVSKIEQRLLKRVLKATCVLTLNWEESIALERMGLFHVIKNGQGRSFTPKIFIRRGNEGVRVSGNIEEKDFPAITVTAKNTLGAGDCFNGAILYGMAKGLSDSSIAELGNITAGLKASKFGTSSGVPSLLEVIEYIEKSGDQRLLSLLKTGI